MVVWQYMPQLQVLNNMVLLVIFPESESCSVVSDSLRPHGLCSAWNPLGQNNGVGSLSLLQSVFPTQELNRDLLHCRWILYQLNCQGSQSFWNHGWKVGVAVCSSVYTSDLQGWVEAVGLRVTESLALGGWEDNMLSAVLGFCWEWCFSSLMDVLRPPLTLFRSKSDSTPEALSTLEKCTHFCVITFLSQWFFLLALFLYFSLLYFFRDLFPQIACEQARVTKEDEKEWTV